MAVLVIDCIPLCNACNRTVHAAPAIPASARRQSVSLEAYCDQHGQHALHSGQSCWAVVVVVWNSEPRK